MLIVRLLSQTLSLPPNHPENGAISFLWSWSYWSTFLLTWAVVPLFQGFEDAGDFTLMTDNLRPTRAEATDVANAVLDGSDAILLGAETLCGLYPVETISNVGRICVEVRAAIKVKASVIICFTSSGRAARQLLPLLFLAPIMCSGLDMIKWVDRKRPRKFRKVLEGEVEMCRRIAREMGVLVDPMYTLAAWETATELTKDEESSSVVVML
ncbi:unnamed protein product [Cochlearia groenlandica]